MLDRMAGSEVCADPGIRASAYVPSNLSGYVVGNAAATGIVVI